MSFASTFDRLAGQLIVSCQPVPGGPLDRPDVVADYVRATTDGGAAGFRIEGEDNIRAAREVTDQPIIGLIKRPFGEIRIGSPARSTMWDAVIDAGADIIAIDSTIRSRPSPVDLLFARARDRDAPILADISMVAEAKEAARRGADAVATTLSLDCQKQRRPALPRLQSDQRVGIHVGRTCDRRRQCPHAGRRGNSKACRRLGRCGRIGDHAA